MIYIKYWRLITKNWKLLYPTFSILDVYREYSLQFPYGFNDKGVLKNVLVDIKFKLKEKKAKEVIQ